jgi:hypothetical protein
MPNRLSTVSRRVFIFLAFDSSLHADWPKAGSRGNIFLFFSSRSRAFPEGLLSIVPMSWNKLLFCIVVGVSSLGKEFEFYEDSSRAGDCYRLIGFGGLPHHFPAIVFAFKRPSSLTKSPRTSEPPPRKRSLASSSTRRGKTWRVRGRFTRTKSEARTPPTARSARFACRSPARSSSRSEWTGRLDQESQVRDPLDRAGTINRQARCQG